MRVYEVGAHIAGIIIVVGSVAAVGTLLVGVVVGVLDARDWWRHRRDFAEVVDFDRFRDRMNHRGGGPA